eukprot:g16459.t1
MPHWSSCCYVVPHPVKLQEDKSKSAPILLDMIGHASRDAEPLGHWGAHTAQEAKRESSIADEQLAKRGRDSAGEAGAIDHGDDQEAQAGPSSAQIDDDDCGPERSPPGPRQAMEIDYDLSLGGVAVRADILLQPAAPREFSRNDHSRPANMRLGAPQHLHLLVDRSAEVDGCRSAGVGREVAVGSSAVNVQVARIDDDENSSAEAVNQVHARKGSAKAQCSKSTQHYSGAAELRSAGFPSRTQQLHRQPNELEQQLSAAGHQMKEDTCSRTASSRAHVGGKSRARNGHAPAPPILNLNYVPVQVVDVTVAPAGVHGHPCLSNADHDVSKATISNEEKGLEHLFASDCKKVLLGDGVESLAGPPRVEFPDDEKSLALSLFGASSADDSAYSTPTRCEERYDLFCEISRRLQTAGNTTEGLSPRTIVLRRDISKKLLSKLKNWHKKKFNSTFTTRFVDTEEEEYDQELRSTGAMLLAV